MGDGQENGVFLYATKSHIILYATKGERMDIPMWNDEPIGTENQREEAKKILLEEIIREVARRLLQAIVQQEVSPYIDMVKEIKDGKGEGMAICHRYLPELFLLKVLGLLL